MKVLSLIIICFIGAVVNIKHPIFLNESYSSGFVNIRENNDIFYWLFESRSNPSTDPLIIWLNGGPGASSLISLFLENGPFRILDDLTLVENAFSWNNKANIVFVDHPVGKILTDQKFD